MRTRSLFRWDGWGSLALPRINAHRMVVVAAALTTLVAAMLAGALAALGGQALPIAVRHDLSGAGDTGLLISGSVSAPEDARYQALLPGELRRALDGTPFTLYHASWSDRSGSPARVFMLPAATWPSWTPPRCPTWPGMRCWYPARGRAPRRAGT